MDAVEGEVRGLQQRSEASTQIWTFRLERFDDAGNRIQPIPVEIRGFKIEGFVSEGDQVEARGKWRRGVLAAKGVYNITTDSVVEVNRYTLGSYIVFAGFVLIVVWIVVLLIFAFFATQQAHQLQNFLNGLIH